MKNFYQSLNQLTTTISVLLLLLCCIKMDGQTTRTVCPSGCGFTTITSALAASTNGDIIQVNVNGAHTESGITISKSITIRGNGKGTTFIQGAASRLTAADRVFNIPRTQASTTLDDALTVVFQDITIRNGYASFLSGGQFSFGGGVQVMNGNGTVVTFTNVDFKNNDTRSSCSSSCSNGGGAGIYVSSTSGNATLGDNSVIINLTNCVFDDNNTGTASLNSSGSGQQGGAILMNARGTINVAKCTFTNNTSFTCGGVMYNGSAIVGGFTDCVFESNNVTEPAAAGFSGSSFSGAGGAFGIRTSTLSFTNCMFKNNSSPGMGGAVWGGTGHTFTNCTFYGNSSQYGGAIYRMNGAANSVLSLINCTLAGNSASIAGRAIIVGNHTPVATSIYNIGLINTIITNNNGAAASDVFFATDYARLTVNQKNYVTSFSGTGTAPTFDYNAGNATLGLATTPANNGGTIETMLLDNTSTLVNVGTNNVSGYNIPVKDARNYSRTDGGVDIGAYEKAGIVDDATAPVITYTALANTALTTNITLSATITDANGIYPWTTLIPRIYFKKGTGSWQSTAGVLSTGNGRSGTWTFTIDNALMGGVASGNQIYYYVIAQDVSSTPTIISNPTGVTASDVNTVIVAPTPNSYLIGSACTAPTVPVISASSNSICNGSSTTLSISSGTLNGATAWKWYTASCGGTAAGTGTSINVSPTANTTYYARGEGGCATAGTCGNISITVNATVIPAITIASDDADNKICSGTNVTFTATPANGGTTPVYQWKLNNANVGTNVATYSNATLNEEDMVTCVLTSNAACASPVTATSAAITMTVTPTAVPALTIASSDADNKICSGTSVTFTATPTNGGTTPAYQWKLNSSNVGTNSATYTVSTLADGDVVTCILTSNAACASPVTATCTGITTNVTPVVVPALTIASSDADNKICSGTSITFTATPTNGGTTPAYQWKLNSSNVGTNSSTYTVSTLADGDVVTCILTSNAACASPATATSTGITTNVTPAVVPALTIASSDADNKICSGTSITFTATPANGGTTPAYQWKLNSSNVGTNSSTYTVSTLADGDVVTCILTSNAACASPATATSTGITTNVTPAVVPALTIASSDADNKICSGTSVTFTATPANGGTTPAYQWKLNSSNVGTNSATYTVSTLADGDVVTCILTSNAACASPVTATATGITTNVTPTVVPALTIASSDADNKICSGTSVTFTATPTNGGSTPAYQWKLNSSNVGTNSANYTVSTLADGDVVTCILTSNAACASPGTATLTGITTNVTPTVVPALTIASNDADNKICSGTSVTFTATPTNGGSTPVYQWKLNSSNVGTNSSTYTVTTLADGDVVTCILTSNAACASPVTATATGITTNVNNTPVTPAITITSNDADNKICSGTSVTFTATPTNGGTTPAYQWKINSSNVGTNSATYSVATLGDGDVVTCILTSNETCVTSTTATSTGITTNVTTVVIPGLTIISSDADNKICSGTNVTFTATPTNGGSTPAYQWKLNSSNVGANSATYAVSTLTNGDVVTCSLTSNATCASPITANATGITTNVTTTVTPGIIITSNDADNKICSGTNITFTATPSNGGTTPAYQWKINSANVGINSATYAVATLADGDVVTCILTSNAACASATTATSTGLNITVNKATTAALTKTSCNNYTLNSQTYTTSGIYTQTIKNAVDCDSTITLNLTINKSSNNTLTQTACDSYTLNSQKYTSTGIYTQTLKNAAGCDSTITLNLTINKSSNNTLTKTACDSYIVNSQTYTTSGTYTQTIKNAAGCDSIITLNLTINKSNNSTLTKTACDSYVLNSQKYTASGTYTQTIKNAAGCDSTITLNLTINKSSNSTLTQTACDSYTLNSQKYTSTGIYTQTLKNAAGCDSTITLNLTINKSNNGTLTKTACNSYILNSQTYTSSGTYIQTIKNAAGCDSTITLNLTINKSSNSTLTKTACDSYVLNSQTYTTSGTYTQTIKNAAGCDSTITLNLTINKSTNSTLTQTACDSYTLNSQKYTSTGIYTQTLKNAAGCDSIITLHLTINKSSNNTLTKTACDSYTLNSQTYTSSGTYTQTIKNAAGCDSTITLNLTINKSSNSTLTKTACDSYVLNNQTYTTSGTYTQKFVNTVGCDSTVILNLTINKSTNSTLNETACDSYTLNNHTYIVTGIYTQKLLNASGCDSTITLNLIINKSSSSTLAETACDSYTLNNQTYTTSGTYTQKILNAAGCDSTITLNLIIKNSSTSNLTETACDTYTLNGKTYTASGIYIQKFINAVGCDSTVTLNLTINKSTSSTLNETACDSYTLNSQTYIASGTYTQKIVNDAGCDSTITLNLIINKSSSSTLTETACDFYILNNQMYTISGIYTQTIANANGCDSVITLNLTIKNSTSSTITAITCGNYILNNETYTTSGIYTQRFTNAVGCDSILTLNLTVNTVDASVVQTTNVLQSVAENATYQWLDCNNGKLPLLNETNQIFTATVNGSYAVTVTQNGCTKTSACYNVTGLSIKEKPWAADITLFPNPTGGNCTLNLGKSYTDVSVRVTDITGKVVYAKAMKNAERVAIILEQQAAGMYYLLIEADGNTANRKIVKDDR